MTSRATATDRGREIDPTAASPATADVAVAAFVAAAGRLDIDGMERILDEAFASQRFELAMDAMVFPALRAVGRSWADGDLDVAAEHAASETVRRRLSHFFDAARGPMEQARLLVGMPPGRTATNSGSSPSPSPAGGPATAVAYLGADVPARQLAADWRARRRVPAIVLGAVTSEDAAAVDLVVDAIGTMDRPPVCFTGGPASLDARPHVGGSPAAAGAR